jgi:hypothetical protein
MVRPEDVSVAVLLCQCSNFSIFLFYPTAPQLAMTSSLMRFLDHTQRRTTVGRTPLDE